MKHATIFVMLVSCSFPVGSQQVSPMGRYNHVAEQMYQLERCDEMTQERWEWLEKRRAGAQRALRWNEAVTREHDDLLIVDFNTRYSTGISKDRCGQLARAADLERKSTAQKRRPPNRSRPS